MKNFQEKIGNPLAPPVFSANSASWGQNLITEWRVPSFGSYDIFVYQEGLIEEISNVGITIIFPTWLNLVTGIPTILIGLVFILLAIRSEKKEMVKAIEKASESYSESLKEEKAKQHQTDIEQTQLMVPFCSNHPKITAAVICPRCSKPFCEKCVVSIYGQNYLCHLCTTMVYQEIYQK